MSGDLTTFWWVVVSPIVTLSVGYWIGYRDGKQGNYFRRRRDRIAHRNLTARGVLPRQPNTTADDEWNRYFDITDANGSIHRVTDAIHGIDNEDDSTKDTDV